jgi:hypothetical protein
VLLTNVVGNGTPLKWTTDPDANPVPLTVNVKSPPPAATDAGLSKVRVGPAVTVKPIALEVTAA